MGGCETLHHRFGLPLKAFRFIRVIFPDRLAGIAFAAKRPELLARKGSGTEHVSAFLLRRNESDDRAGAADWLNGALALRQKWSDIIADHDALHALWSFMTFSLSSGVVVFLPSLSRTRMAELKPPVACTRPGGFRWCNWVNGVRD